MIERRCLLALLPLALAQADEPNWIDLFLEGDRALERGEFVAARESLERALGLLPGHGATAWALAAICAREGDHAGAFEWLERAVTWGGGDAALLEWDPDLSSLHGLEQFAALRERLAARAPFTTLEGEIVWSEWSWSTSVSPRAEVVATGLEGSTALLDLRAGEVLAVLDRPGWHISEVVFSPDGRWAIGTGRRTDKEWGHEFVRIFDAITGDWVRDLSEGGSGTKIAFSRDGGRVLVTRSSIVPGAVWETAGWSRIATLPQRGDWWLSPPLRHQVLKGPAQCLLSADGTHVLMLFRRDEASSDLLLWNVDEERIVAEHRIDSIPETGLDISGDGKLALALENKGDSLFVYDMHTGEQLWTIDKSDLGASTAAFLGASGELVTIGDRLKVWSASGGRALRTLRMPLEEKERRPWYRIHGTPEGGTLLLQAYHGPLHAIDTGSGELLWTTGAGPNDRIGRARLSPDGSRVLTSTYGAFSAVRDTRTGEVLSQMRGPCLATIAEAHPVRSEIWLGVADGSLRRIDAATGRTLATWRHGRAKITGLSFAPDGARLATTDDAGVLRILDARDGTLLSAHHQPHRGDSSWSVGRDGFAPDSSSLAVTAPTHQQRALTVYDAATSVPRYTIELESWFEWTWSPDGRSLAIAQDHRVRIFDAHTGKPAGPAFEIDCEASVIAFEPDGQRLWVGNDRSGVFVFEVLSGDEVHRMDVGDLDPFGEVCLSSISFSPAGDLAITASDGYSVLVCWETRTGKRLWGYSFGDGNPSPMLTAFCAHGDRVSIGGPESSSLRIVDAANGQTLLDLGERGLDGLLPLAQEQLVAIGGRQGLEVIDTESGTARWKRIELGDDGWLLSAPTHHVDGTRAALEQLHILLEQRSYALDSLAAVLLDPRKVRASAAGVEVSPARMPAIPELSWVSPTARTIHISAGEEPPTITLEATCPSGVSAFEMQVGGRREHASGTVVDAGKRRLTLQLESPKRGETLHYRWRARSTQGVLSRALHLTVEGRD